MLNTNSYDFLTDPASLALWALEQNIWDGKAVKKEDKEKISKACFNKLLALTTFRDGDEKAVKQFTFLAALAGTSPEKQIALLQEIESINQSFDGWTVKNVGWGDDLKSFWEDHKVEILIGAAAIAIITAVAIVTISSGGAAAGIATTAAGGALAALEEKEKSPKTFDSTDTINETKKAPQYTPHVYGNTSPPSYDPSYAKDLFLIRDLKQKNPISITEPNQFSFKDTPPHQSFKDFSFLNNQFPNSYFFENPNYSLPFSIQNTPPLKIEEILNIESILHKSTPKEFLDSPPINPFLFEKSLPVFNSENTPLQVTWYDIMNKSVRQWLNDGIEGFPTHIQMPQYNHCLTFTTNKNQNKKIWIGGINGINTNLKEAVDHAEYIDKLTGNSGVNWVYNHTNGAPIDVLEAGFANLMLKYSPETSRLLRKNWEEFHEATKDTPEVKYLQFCHSQGAALTKNALHFLPEEIAKRIFIVAIAPLTVIPSHLCGGSINIASPIDKVPNIEKEVIFHTIRDLLILQKALERLEKERRELIFLQPNEPQTKWDHEFQSKTYAKAIEQIVKQYIENNGEISESFDLNLDEQASFP